LYKVGLLARIKLCRSACCPCVGQLECPVTSVAVSVFETATWSVYGRRSWATRPVNNAPGTREISLRSVRGTHDPLCMVGQLVSANVDDGQSIQETDDDYCVLL